MSDSLSIKMRRRRVSDFPLSFFIEGNFENLKQLQFHYYHISINLNDDNSLSSNYLDKIGFNNSFSESYNDASTMISDTNHCYKCHENNCNQSFDSLIKASNDLS